MQEIDEISNSNNFLFDGIKLMFLESNFNFDLIK